MIFEMLNGMLNKMLKPDFSPCLYLTASLGVVPTPHLDHTLPSSGYCGQGVARLVSWQGCGSEVGFYD